MEETGYRIRDNNAKNKENVRYEDYGNIGRKKRSTENNTNEHKIFQVQQNHDMAGETGLGRDGNRI